MCVCVHLSSREFCGYLALTVCELCVICMRTALVPLKHARIASHAANPLHARQSYVCRVRGTKHVRVRPKFVSSLYDRHTFMYLCGAHKSRVCTRSPNRWRNANVFCGSTVFPRIVFVESSLMCRRWCHRLPHIASTFFPALCDASQKLCVARVPNHTLAAVERSENKRSAFRHRYGIVIHVAVADAPNKNTPTAPHSVRKRNSQIIAYV